MGKRQEETESEKGTEDEKETRSEKETKGEMFQKDSKCIQMLSREIK